MSKKSIGILMCMIVIVIAITGCGEYSTNPTKSAKKYVKKLIKEENYNLEVGEAVLKYYGDLDRAKELYGSEVENKSSIQDYCVVKVTLVSKEGEESSYEVDCIKYNDKWRAMGEHSEYKESNEETDTAEDILPKIQINGDN